VTSVTGYCLSVRPSVTFLYYIEMSKHSQTFSTIWWIYHSSFSLPNVMAVFGFGPLTGALNTFVWYEKIAIFDHYLALSRKLYN